MSLVALVRAIRLEIEVERKNQQMLTLFKKQQNQNYFYEKFKAWTNPPKLGFRVDSSRILNSKKIGRQEAEAAIKKQSYLTL